MVRSFCVVEVGVGKLLAGRVSLRKGPAHLLECSSKAEVYAGANPTQHLLSARKGLMYYRRKELAMLNARSFLASIHQVGTAIALLLGELLLAQISGGMVASADFGFCCAWPSELLQDRLDTVEVASLR